MHAEGASALPSARRFDLLLDCQPWGLPGPRLQRIPSAAIMRGDISASQHTAVWARAGTCQLFGASRRNVHRRSFRWTTEANQRTSSHTFVCLPGSHPPAETECDAQEGHMLRNHWDIVASGNAKSDALWYATQLALGIAGKHAGEVRLFTDGLKELASAVAGVDPTAPQQRWGDIQLLDHRMARMSTPAQTVLLIF